MRTRLHSDRGSMTIEFVAVVPLLILVTIVCIQGFAVVSAMEATQRAARDASRAAGMEPGGAAAGRTAALRALPDWVQVTSIDVGSGSGCAGICSDVRVHIPIGFPGFLSVGGFDVRRTADLPDTGAVGS